MNSMIDAIISDDTVFESTTDAERGIAARWIGQRFGTNSIKFLLLNYPSMFTRLVALIRAGTL